jgi:DNA invertase Pin-like site-specific DNA recombinase
MERTQSMRAVGYVRVSTGVQAERGVSLDAQRARIAAYCVAMDLDLVAVIADEGLSARSLDRPGLTSALAMLKEGSAEALLVVKLDRLTRSVRDLGALVETYFAQGRWSLLSVADSIDTRTAAGRLVLNVLVSVAQWEREATVERTVDALTHLRASGVQLGGAALGWKHTEATDPHGRRVVETVAHEAETIARIRELRAAGVSYRGIVATLTKEDRPTKLGGRWHVTTVARVCERDPESHRAGLPSSRTG